MTGLVVPKPTREGLFSMEGAVFVLLLTSCIVVEMREVPSHGDPKVRFRNLAYLLVGFLGSGSVYAALIVLLRLSGALAELKT